MRKLTLLFFALNAWLLTGCATPKSSLYNWGPYEPQVYAFFKGESPEQQTQILEKHLAETLAKNTVPPPGLYAHLGMLYSKTGRDAEVVGMFEKEKKLYPESKVFLDNVLNGFKGIK